MHYSGESAISLGVTRLQRFALLCLTPFIFAGCDEESANLFGHVVVGLHMVQRFQEEYGIDIDIPPIKYHQGPCPEGVAGDPDCSYATSIIYIDDSVYEMRLLAGESSAIGTRLDGILRPEGLVNVLTIGIARNYTSLETDFPTEWVAAQAVINQQHADYATAIGLTEPILQFTNTNVVLPRSTIGGVDFSCNSNSSGCVADTEQWVLDQGFSWDDFDVIVVMNLDPKNSAGGWGLFTKRLVVVEYFFAENNSNNVDITPAEWGSFAGAVYHHEIGHVHGWQHDWPDELSGPGAPFITCPANYGWTDVDGDGIVEILDPDPYMSPSSP